MNNNNYQNPTDCQTRYWHFMYELTGHIYYLEAYLQHYQKIDRWIKSLLAITSSSSIAGWVIWQKYSFVWAFLIAFSQLINSIKHLIPFAKREEIIKDILPELRKLLFECELAYYNISNGLITDSSIHERTIKFKQRKNTAAGKLDNNVLPESEQFMQEAEGRAKSYLDYYYGG